MRRLTFSICIPVLLVTTFFTVSLAWTNPQAHGRNNLHRRHCAQSVATASSLQSGDTVLVIGATSGVGQLATRKLTARGFSVRATCRTVATGSELFREDNKVDVVPLNLLQCDNHQIQTVMAGTKAIVICVGTTAFPSNKWANGNTPDAIDRQAVTKIANCIRGDNITPKKICLVTSVGVERSKQMPFLILNLFGVLDAKRDGETAIKDACRQNGDDHVIIRPGRLVGGPFTNLDIPKLLQLQGGAENGVTVQVGDSLLGDCKRDACAEAIVQSLINEKCSNVEFAIVSNENQALVDEQWTEVFQSMQT
jgi:nucleoside-diphosphate-sugar epimerase